MLEPLIDPELDQGWTSDRELDRLAPLVESLRYWSEVYDRWGTHELATVRPAQARFGRADLTAIADLRGVHFGQLAAASRRLRQVGLTAARLTDLIGVVRSGSTQAWPGGVSRRLMMLQQDVQDCAERCAGLGTVLELSVVEAVAPVITSAVDEILVRSGELVHRDGRCCRETFEQRIAKLSVSGDVGASPELAQVWRAELDTFVARYASVIGQLRATLAAAKATVIRIYQTAGLDISSTGDPGPSSGSSSAGGGGNSDLVATPVRAIPGALGPGSAMLGELSESRGSDPGSAKLGSTSDDGVRHGDGTDPSWTSPLIRDKERRASWARLRALLGEQASERDVDVSGADLPQPRS